MKVAIYARVSTKMQAEDELPIEGQIDECRKYAQGKGWQVVKVYQDAGYSGGTVEGRLGFQEMYYTAKDSKPSPFGVVLVWRSNRLFRDVEQRLAYTRLFKRHGVKLVSLHEPEYEGASGKLAETMFAAIDEYYRYQTSEDTLRGLKQVAMRGYSTGGLPATGYRNVRVSTGRIKCSGDPEMRTSWEMDPVTAPRVRQAFEMCASGATNVEIVEATRIVSAKNGLSTLLRNRAYLGERIYNTTRRLSLSEKKTRRAKNKPDDIIVIPNCHPAIVSQELFDRVQTVLESKRPKMGQRKCSSNNYMLSGLLWCKVHDCAYAGHTTSTAYYYACAMRKRLGKKRVPCPWLKKDAIEQFVIDQLMTKVFTRGQVRAGLEYLQAETARNKADDDTELEETKAQLRQTHIELERFYVAIKKGIDAGILQKPINELKAQSVRLERQIAELEKERERTLKIPPVTDAMVDDVINKMMILLSNQNTGEIKATLAHFIDRIEVKGNTLTFNYHFSRPIAEFMPTSGDPGGLAAVGIFKTRVKLDASVFPRNSGKMKAWRK